jgi:hypothetical protein
MVLSQEDYTAWFLGALQPSGLPENGDQGHSWMWQYILSYNFSLDWEVLKHNFSNLFLNFLLQSIDVVKLVEMQ